MNFIDALTMASEYALDEDANHVIGRISGSWQVAHDEDIGRQHEMAEPKIQVDASGMTPNGRASLVFWLEEIANVESEFSGCPDCLENSIVQYRLPFAPELAIKNKNKKGFGWELFDYEPLRKINCKCKEVQK